MRLAEARSRLGVPEGASWDAVKAAYKRLARLHHPDKSDSPEATVTMQGLTEAFGTLKRHHAPASGSRDEGGGSGEAADDSEEEYEYVDDDNDDEYEDEDEDEEADDEAEEVEADDYESDGESTASTDAHSGTAMMRNEDDVGVEGGGSVETQESISTVYTLGERSEEGGFGGRGCKGQRAHRRQDARAHPITTVHMSSGKSRAPHGCFAFWRRRRHRWHRQWYECLMALCGHRSTGGRGRGRTARRAAADGLGIVAA